MALILYRPLFWILLPLLITLLLWLAFRLRLRWWPAWFLRLFLMAAILWVIFSPRGELFDRSTPTQQILLVDLSDSVAAEARGTIQAEAQAWHQAGPNRLVVVFGREAHVISSPEETWPLVDGRGSDVAGALTMAANMLGPSPAQLIIASDGLAAPVDAVEAAVSDLLQRAQAIDVIWLPPAAIDHDLHVGELRTSSYIWEGAPFQAVLPVVAPRDGVATVRLTVDDALYTEQVESLTAGEHVVTFQLEAPAPGVVTLAAEVLFDNDNGPENNQSFAVVQVLPSPKVLFVTEASSTGVAFVAALQASGLQVDVTSPDKMAIDLTKLDAYQVIFLNNLPAPVLTQEQMIAMKVFVSRKGGGLVFLGGDSSYLLGDYSNTVMEGMLPLILEPPPRMKRPPVTFVIVFDRSGSMASVRGPLRRIDLAREAAMRAIETLEPDDYVGVMTFGSEVIWEAPLNRIGDGLTLRQAQDAISQVRAQGATFMYKALSQAIDDMESINPTETRLVLLLSDGHSSDGSQEEFESLALRAQEEVIVISTIALGDDADEELMEQIAAISGGRYHPVIEPAELPRIMIGESQAARSEYIQIGQTTLAEGEVAHPVLFSLSLSDLPPVTGYHALTSKIDEGAEDILLSANFGDPLLSNWQYGLGRVVAWTTDIGDEWASDWLRWPQGPLFWSQLVRYAISSPAANPAQITIESNDTNLVVRFVAQSELDLPLNWANPRFLYVDEEDATRSLPLLQVGPGTYTAEATLPPSGAYRALVRYEQDESLIDLAAPFIVNYPIEWRPSDPQAGYAALSSWATLTGGREIVNLQDGSNMTSGTIRQGPATSESALERLLLLFVLYWPIEVALRRRWLPWT
jgi:Ca-activated chloride channel homolog